MAWLMGNEAVAPSLTPKANSLCEDILEGWRDAWLYLLPKVLQPTVPNELRPIGLQNIRGKTVSTVFRDRLAPFVQAAFVVFPNMPMLETEASDNQWRGQWRILTG